MTDEIGFRGTGHAIESTLERRLVPMKIGEATVFVEQVGEFAKIETDDRIYPVVPPGPQDAFEQAGQILQASSATGVTDALARPRNLR